MMGIADLTISLYLKQIRDLVKELVELKKKQLEGEKHAMRKA